MSKTQLKKELARMTADQIGELLLELYDARPEAREYLDFFVKPDIDSKLEKARSLIKKEMWRTSRGHNRARSTRIRRYIKDIASLNPGPDAVCEIMTFSIETACAAGSEQWIKESTQKALAKLLGETLREADRTGLLDIYLPRIEAAVKGMRSSWFRSNEFKNHLKETLNDTLQNL